MLVSSPILLAEAEATPIAVSLADLPVAGSVDSDGKVWTAADRTEEGILLAAESHQIARLGKARFQNPCHQLVQ